MSGVQRLLGIPPIAVPAWAALSAALDDLASRGRQVVCAAYPAAADDRSDVCGRDGSPRRKAVAV